MPRLRFSIRDLLWLTLVAALCVGWLMDRRNCSLHHSELKIVKLGGQSIIESDNDSSEPLIDSVPDKGLGGGGF